jgi:hypothetical protein
MCPPDKRARRTVRLRRNTARIDDDHFGFRGLLRAVPRGAPCIRNVRREIPAYFQFRAYALLSKVAVFDACTCIDAGEPIEKRQSIFDTMKKSHAQPRGFTP